MSDDPFEIYLQAAAVPRKQEGDPADLEGLLEYKFANPALLRQALTRRDRALEDGRPGADNERLEFLGDAVLALAISELLLKARPIMPEGKLSIARSNIVSNQQGSGLHWLATRLELGRYLRAGRGATDHNAVSKNHVVLCKTAEAVIGALFTDGGLEPVQRLFDRWSEDLLARAEAGKDAKSRLKEFLESQVPPRSLDSLEKRESQAGAAGSWTVSLAYAGSVGEGTAPKKKDAEQQACEELLGELAERG